MDELVDVLDSVTGKATGEVISKSEAHSKGIWHGAVHIWVINSLGDKILLQKRCALKKLFPNMWDISVGGHISNGEDAYIGALRELNEELGIVLENEKLEFVKCIKEEFVSSGIISNEFVTVYKLVKDIEISDITLQDEEVSDVMWVNKEDFNKLIDEKKIIDHSEEFKLLNEIL